MTMSRLWAFLAIALPVLASLIAGLSAVDLAYHVRTGGIILDTGTIPSSDTYTFTASGASWVDQQWLAQVILAAVQRVSGWAGLAILRAALVGLTFGLVLGACRARGLDLRRAAWLTILAFCVSAVALALRPQLLGMALFALTLLLVADRRAHPLRLWAVPLIVLVWANVHGSFFLGPVLLGLAWLEDLHDRDMAQRRTLVIGALSILAAFITPFGPAVWIYALGLTTNSLVTSRITEWQPTTLRSAEGIAFFASVGLVLIVIARRGRATPWPTLAWFAVFAVIGAYAVRGAAWWPLAAVVAVAGLVGSAARVDATSPAGDGSAGRAGSGVGAVAARRDRARPLNLVVVALLVIVSVGLLPIWRPIDQRIGAPTGVVADAPAGITAALRDLAKSGDRILNPQPWGSWFEFALPDNPVAIDSRIEVFPVQVWDDYERVRSGGEGWLTTLAGWRVAIAVAGVRETGFRDRLIANGWRDAYHDEDGTILLAPAAPG
jgi:hypothetical protein